MTDVATGSTPVFDPFSDEFFNDPYDLYRRMRDEAPVSYNEQYGFWALFRYEDVARAHREWQAFSSAHGVDLSMLTKPPELVRQLNSMIMLDPPEHDRLRALVSRVFTPKAVAALEPMVNEVIGGILDQCDDEGFDVVGDFSGPFPVEVISRMLGVPAPDRQQIRHWLDIMLHREPGEMEPTAEGAAAAIETVVYFMDLVAEKRAPAGRRHDQPARRRRSRPRRRGGHQARRRGDRRLRRPARWSGGGDGHQAGGQRRRALRPPSR